MYKLTKHIFIILLLVIGSKSFAQVRPVFRSPNFQQKIARRQNRVEQVREAYLSRRLELTPEQSVRFWPIYRQYQDAITAITQKRRQNTSSAQPDGAAQIQNELYYEGELVNTRKFYTNEFLKILPAEKVSEMFKAEREFKDELIRQLRERSQPVSNNPPN